MYADDCILFSSGNNCNIIIDGIQSDLHNVDQRCYRNRLRLSETKAKVLLIGSNLKVKEIEYTNNFLLVILDSSLLKSISILVCFWTGI